MKYLIWKLFKAPEVEAPFKPKIKQAQPKLEALPVEEEAGKVFEYGKEWEVSFNPTPGAEVVHLEYDATKSIQTLKVDSRLTPADWSTIQAYDLKADKYRNIKVCILQGDTYTQIVDKFVDKEGYKKRTIEEYGRLIRKAINVDNERKSRPSAG